ncbi:uncharacterized protein LOC117780173 [Drosophila innubila]|uniref:uncharacterized protein LOC117780173 n=1 Tax=Drosophila innubila TaxID=198719 RepID=UPI00148C39ED|nr:uncharacterized protein LOC117780173 [Drosophila innubila]
MRSSFLILCVLLCCSLGSSTLFDDDLRELTEFLRLQMQCGYPERGIPILAPAQRAFKAIDISTDSFRCEGNFTDLSVVGLDGFEFYKLKWSNIKHNIQFDMTFPRIQLNSSNYKLNILSHLLGSDVSMWGDGVFDLELINLRANGSFVIRPSTLTQGTHIKSWKVDWQLGKSNSKITGIMGKNLMVSKIFNQFIDEFFELLINDNPNEISQFMEQLIVSPMNSVLENVAWYEISAIILGLVKGILPVEPIC